MGYFTKSTLKYNYSVILNIYNSLFLFLLFALSFVVFVSVLFVCFGLFALLYDLPCHASQTGGQA